MCEERRFGSWATDILIAFHTQINFCVNIILCKNEQRLNQCGKRVGFYLSQIKHLHLFMEDEKFKMKIKMADGGWDYYSSDDETQINGKITKD